jgi:hypothetical protein
MVGYGVAGSAGRGDSDRSLERKGDNYLRPRSFPHYELLDGCPILISCHVLVED